MNRNNFQELIRNLQIFSKCPSCGASYHFDDIKFLGKVDSSCFMQLSCHECSLPVLATVMLSGTEQVEAEPAKPKSYHKKTDLKPREKAKFKAKGAISSTEIAEFHLKLTKHKQTK